MKKQSDFLKGVYNGIPIALGYIPSGRVSHFDFFGKPCHQRALSCHVAFDE